MFTDEQKKMIENLLKLQEDFILVRICLHDSDADDEEYKRIAEEARVPYANALKELGL